MIPRYGSQHCLSIGCKLRQNIIHCTRRRKNHVTMSFEDLGQRRGMQLLPNCTSNSRVMRSVCCSWQYGYWVMLMHGDGDKGWWSHERNMSCDEDVVWGVTTSDKVAWFHWQLIWLCCVGSCVRMQMVYRNMDSGLKLMDELYIKRACWHWRIFFCFLCTFALV